MQKRRSGPRTETMSKAIVTMADGTEIFCYACDLSFSGAKLRFRDVNLVPHDFQLRLRDTGETRRARVCWRRNTDVGVVFVHEKRGFGRRANLPGSEKY